MAAPFVAATKEAAVYDQSLRDVNKIMKQSEEQLEAYGEKLRTISQELGVTAKATDAAAAAERIASAGFVDAASNTKMLEASLQAATAGKVNAGQYAQFLAQTLQGYGASADDAAKYTDILFRAVQEGITEIPELANSLGRVTGIAAGAGVTFEELGAIMATATLRGATTSSAVDGLRGAIMNLQAPSKQASDELARIGVKAGESTLKQQGLVKTLQDIAAANGNSAESWKKILGDAEAVNIAQKLMADGGKLASESIRSMGDSAGYTAEAVAEHMKGAVANWEAFTSALQSAGIAVGQNFLPAVVTTLQAGTKLVSMFAGAPPVLQAVFTAVAALGAAYQVSSKALVLLTTLEDRERLARLASNTARVLSAELVFTNTKALGAETLATTASETATIRGAGAKALFTTATKGATTALGGMRSALAASWAVTTPFGMTLAVVAGVAAGAAVAFSILTKKYEEVGQASKKLLDVELRMAKGQRDYAKMVGKTTEELKAQGLAASDLTSTLLANLERQEAARKAGNSSLLQQLQQENADIRQQRKELAEEEAKKRAAPSTEEEFHRKRSAAEQRALEKLNEKVEKQREKSRKEALAADLHALDVKKKSGELSARQEIAALEQILKVKGGTLKIEEQQRIEAEIAAANGKIKADNEKRWADAAKKSAEAGKQAAKESFDLQQQKLETERDAKKTIEEKLEIEKQLVDLEAEKALYSEKNKKNRASILENAKAEKALLEKQAADEAARRDADLAAKRTDLAKETAVEEEAAQTATFEKRRRQLDEEEARGRNVRAERLKLEREELTAAEAASKKKLELAKTEAAAKRKAADVDASPAEQKINAEREALEIRVAEREAAKESQEIFDKSNASLVERLKYLREQLELMKKAKEEAKGQTFSGPYGLDQINENLSGWGVSKSRRGQVNQDGMTESQIQQEISATEGRLGNRKEGRRTSESSFGTSKWDKQRAADKKAVGAETGDYFALGNQILQALLSLGGSVKKSEPNSRKGGGAALGYTGVPYQLQPNSAFS